MDWVGGFWEALGVNMKGKYFWGIDVEKRRSKMNWDLNFSMSNLNLVSERRFLEEGYSQKGRWEWGRGFSVLS